MHSQVVVRGTAVLAQKNLSISEVAVGPSSGGLVMEAFSY